MYNERAIWITGILTFLMTSVLWIGVGTLIYHVLTRDPPNFEVMIEHPDSVTLNEEFVLVVKVKDPAGEPLNLGSIDFETGLLNGFEVLSVHPKPLSKQKIPNYTSYYFKTLKKSPSEFIFTLNLRARKVGEWAGDIDCCTPLENFVTHYTEISVVEPQPRKDQET